jgi:hypothetical protein
LQKEIEEGVAHVCVIVSQTPLQQSLFAPQVLPAVWQPLPSCKQVPLEQALGPLQQGAPPPHDCPSEMHCVLPQVPPVQFKLQQSPGTLQLPAVLHSGCTHWFEALHMPEQHWPPVAQVTPPPRQGILPLALRSMTP